HHRENAFHEATARFADTAEAALAPPHRPTQQPLQVIIGRLDSLHRHERPQRRLQRQPVVAKARYRWVLTQDSALQQQPLQPIHDRSQVVVELSPRGLALLERMARREDLGDALPPLPTHEDARAPGINALVTIAYELRRAHPAQ